MNTQESSHARACVLICAHIPDSGLRGTANGDLRVPDANIALGSSGYVDLKDDGARKRLRDTEAHVGNTSDAYIAGVANFHNWLRAIGVLECSSGT
jgi:hypothetical protein